MGKTLGQILDELKVEAWSPSSKDSIRATDVFYPEVKPGDDILDTLHDIPKKKLFALRKFAGSHTENNEFPVTDKNTEDSELSTINLKGNSLKKDFEFGQKHFTDNDKILFGKMFFTSEQLEKFLDKTGKDTDKTGNNILKNIDEKGYNENSDTGYTQEVDQNSIVKQIIENLDQNNLYSPMENTPFIKMDGDDAGKLSKGLFKLTKKGDFGKYNKNNDVITLEDARQMTMQLMLQAQSARDIADLIDKDFDSSGYNRLSDLSAATPNKTQMGVKIPISDLKLSSTKHFEEKIGKDSHLENSLFLTDSSADGLHKNAETDNSLSTSYGNMNSFLEPFDGPMPGGMVMPAMYSMLSILAFNSLMEGIFIGTKQSQISYDKTAKIRNPENPESLSLGSFASESDVDNLNDKLLKLIGFYNTDSDWGKCVLKGLELFYGIKGIDDLIDSGPNLNTFSLIVDQAVNLIQAPGFYVVMQKQIVRDIENITKTARGFNGSLGVLSGTSQFFRMIEALTSSKAFKFLMICAKIGDQALKGKYAPGQNAHDGALVYTKEQQKEVELTAQTRGSLSRFTDPSTQDNVSPLSLTKHPALLNMTSEAGLIPLNLLKQKLNGAGEGFTDNPSGFLHVKDVKDTGTNRFSKEDVDFIEQQINAEYVPFSFQDIRTNEIIALPAFIESINENFAPKYEEKEAYGRIDPVMTYSSTKRTIDLTFNLVAMNEEDHNYLWFVINKLTSMCYPQRSQGKIRTGKIDGKNLIFTQPFSQIPTASPLVRIRIGDLIKSNFSSQKLRQLFGEGKTLSLRNNIDDDALNVNSKEQNELFNNNRIVNSLRRKTIMHILKEKNNDFAKGDYSGNLTLPAGTFVSFEGTTVGLTKKFKFKLIKSVDVVVNPFKKNNFTLKDNINSSKKAEMIGGTAFKNFYNEQGGDTISFTNIFTFSFDKNNVKPKFTVTETDINSKINLIASQYNITQTSLQLNINNHDTLKNFFNPTNNAIVRAFESTSGKGMAGFITSLALNYDQTVWGAATTGGPYLDQNLRAPKKVKVTLSFAPIHDLPLGLNEDGIMLSPSHPTGKYFNEDFFVNNE